jgi:ERCC4-type nuclease
MSNNNNFTIIVDTREQKPWEFTEYATAVRKLDTGDYSVEGLEQILCIERKRNVSEIANNITESRFKDVLSRMSKYRFPFILLEFDLQQVLDFPVGSDIPKSVWPKIKISPKYILKCILEMSLVYNIYVIFCGSKSNAEIYATSIMKKVYDKYGNQQEII